MFASKAFPCTAVLALFAEEGLWCDVASGGELHLALARRLSARSGSCMHGNAKSEAELRHGAGAARRAIVIDNFDEIDRLRGCSRERGGAGAPSSRCSCA